MSLAGTGVIAIWNDITAGGRANFYEWHTREHMPERASVTGFLRGRRYIALAGQPAYYTLYETADPSVHTGAAYTERLNNPTPWTRRSVADFENTARALCRVEFSTGAGQGGLIMTWRYDVAAGREAAQRAWLAGALPAVAARPGVCGAHLCVTDAAASAIVTEEKKVRPSNLAAPGWVVMVEGAGERAALEAACDELLAAAAFAAAGALGPLERGLYQLQNSCGATP